MKNDLMITLRLPKALYGKAQETAHQRDETISAVLRHHLDAYVSTQPLKTAKK